MKKYIEKETLNSVNIKSLAKSNSSVKLIRVREYASAESLSYSITYHVVIAHGVNKVTHEYASFEYALDDYTEVARKLI